MATYIPNVTDYVPQIQPFKPDYNFYGNILQTKQSQFDTNHKQLSGVYSTLLNSPMSRDQNLIRRDNFFKAIDQDIKKISGMDLSLEENVNAANKVFTSFYNDPNMVNDMVKTKKWMSEIERGNNYRNCVDPSKCGGQFWEVGLQALQYKHEDFRKASDDEALRMDMGRYVPYQNFTDQAFKAAKDAGFTIKTDTVNGGYIVTTKNGQQLTPQLHDYFMAKFGDDPKMIDVFKTQAYVQRKNYITSRASQLGNEDAAENEYITSIVNSVPQKQRQAKKDADEKHDAVENRLKVLSDRIKSEGASPDDEIVKSFQDLQEQYQITTKNKTLQENASNQIQTSQNIKDPSQYKDRIDDIVAYAMLQQHSMVTAENYAMRDQEVSIKADPYTLASHEASLDLRNMMAGKAADFDYWTKKETYKQALEAKKKAEELDKMNRILGLDSSPVADMAAPGAATPMTTTTEQTNIDERNSLYGQYNIDQRSFLREMAGSMKAAYEAAGQSDVQGGGDKQKLILQTAKEVFKGTNVDPAKLLGSDPYNTELSKINGMNITSAKSSYDKALVNVNPNSKGLGAENSFWSQSFWNDKAGITEQIKVREKLIKAFDKTYLDNANNAKAQTMAKYVSSGDRNVLNMLNVFTDPSGRKRTKEEFINTYASTYKNNYDPAKIYNNDQLQMMDSQNAIPSEIQSARSDASRMYDKLNEEYSRNYQSVGKASNGLNMFNGKSNANATGAYWYKFEPALMEHNGTLNGYSFFRNYDQLKASDPTSLNVKFGESDVVGNNEDAKKVLDLLEADSKRLYKPTDDKRPTMRYRAQNVAGGNANMTAVHFEVPQKWLSQYTKKGGILADIDQDQIAKGITLFIPKDKASNQYYNDNQEDDYDRLLNIEGQINIDTYPQAGKIQLKRVGNKFIATGHYNDITRDNKVVPTTYYKEYPIENGLKPGRVVSVLNEEMKKYSIDIQNFRTTYNAQHGIKDPSQLLAR